MDSFFQNLINPEHLRKIEDAFIVPYSKTVMINLKNKTDYNTIIDNRFAFMIWNGPQAEVSAVVHEIAHMLEIDDKRCHRPDFGLKYGKSVYIPGHGMVNEGMNTKLAIQREIRTFGIQLVILNHFKIPYSVDNKWEEGLSDSFRMAKLCDFIDGITRYWPKEYRQYAKEKREREEASGVYERDDRFPLRDLQKHAFTTIEKLIISERDKWTIDAIMEKWKERMKLLRRKQTRGCWKSYN